MLMQFWHYIAVTVDNGQHKHIEGSDEVLATCESCSIECPQMTDCVAVITMAIELFSTVATQSLLDQFTDLEFDFPHEFLAENSLTSHC